MGTTSERERTRPAAAARGRGANRRAAPAGVALGRIHAYLQHLCRRLGETARTVRADMPIRGHGILRDLTQTDYRVTRGRVGDCRRVRLQMMLRRAEPQQFQVPCPRGNRDFLRGLKEDGLRILGSRVAGLNSDTPRVLFEVAGEVPVELEFEACAADPERVDLLVVNFDRLGVARYEFGAEEFDGELLRQLGLFILRRPNHLLRDRPGEREAGRFHQRLTRAETLQEIGPPPTRAEVLDFQRAARRARRLLLRYGGEELVLDARRSVCRIGRKFPSDILVRSRFASRDHASIVLHEGEFLLHDHSNNGTFVRPDGGPELLIHNGAHRLRGSGVISPGEYIQDGVDLIHYRVE